MALTPATDPAGDSLSRRAVTPTVMAAARPGRVPASDCGLVPPASDAITAVRSDLLGLPQAPGAAEAAAAAGCGENADGPPSPQPAVEKVSMTDQKSTFDPELRAKEDSTSPKYQSADSLSETECNRFAIWHFKVSP